MIKTGLNNHTVENKNNYGSFKYLGLLKETKNYKFSKLKDIDKLNHKPIFLDDGIIDFEEIKILVNNFLNSFTSDQVIDDSFFDEYVDLVKVKEFEEETNKLCETWVKLAQLKKTNPWDMDDLLRVLP